MPPPFGCLGTYGCPFGFGGPSKSSAAGPLFLKSESAAASFVKAMAAAVQPGSARRPNGRRGSEGGADWMEPHGGSGRCVRSHARP